MYCAEEVESDLIYVNRFSYKGSMGSREDESRGETGRPVRREIQGRWWLRAWPNGPPSGCVVLQVKWLLVGMLEVEGGRNGLCDYFPIIKWVEGRGKEKQSFVCGKEQRQSVGQ